MISLCTLCELLTPDMMLALLLGTCIAVALLLTLAVIMNRIINILFRFENFLEQRGFQTLVKPIHALNQLFVSKNHPLDRDLTTYKKTLQQAINFIDQTNMMAEKEICSGTLTPEDKDILEFEKIRRSFVRHQFELWIAGQDVWTSRALWASKNEFDQSWRENKMLCKLSFGCCACGCGCCHCESSSSMSYDLEVFTGVH